MRVTHSQIFNLAYNLVCLARLLPVCSVAMARCSSLVCFSPLTDVLRRQRLGENAKCGWDKFLCTWGLLRQYITVSARSVRFCRISVTNAAVENETAWRVKMSRKTRIHEEQVFLSFNNLSLCYRQCNNVSFGEVLIAKCGEQLWPLSQYKQCTAVASVQ